MVPEGASVSRLAKFAPAQKDFPSAHSTDRAALGRVIERFERFGEAANQRDVEEVVRRTMDLDLRDVSAEGHTHVAVSFFRHDASSVSSDLAQRRNPSRFRATTQRCTSDGPS